MKKKLCYLFIFLAFLVMEYQVIPLLGVIDDAVFLTKLNNLGIFNFMKDFYYNWGGRIIITIIATLSLKELLIYKFINAFIFTFLIYQLAKLFSLKKNSSLLLLTFILLGLNLNLLSSSSLWIVGSLNYLWPTCGLITILNFIKIDKFNWLNGLIYFLASLLAFSQEQTGAVALVMIIIALIKAIILKEKKLKLLFALLIAIILTIILFSAPGNYLRSASELIRWYPQFKMFSILDKIISGIFLLNIFLMKRFQLVIFIISFIVALNNEKKLAKIPLIYFVIRFLLGQLAKFNILANLYYSLYDFNFFSQVYYLDWTKFISNSLAFVIIILLSYYLIDLLELNLKLESNSQLQIDLTTFSFILLYYAAIVSVVVIGFSPTFVGSGSRIYFLSAVIFSGILTYLVDRGFLYYKLIIWIFIILTLANYQIVLKSSEFLYQYF